MARPHEGATQFVRACCLQDKILFMWNLALEQRLQRKKNVHIQAVLLSGQFNFTVYVPPLLGTLWLKLFQTYCCKPGTGFKSVGKKLSTLKIFIKYFIII